MLESCRNAQERWGGVHLLIDRWLQERHALINAFDGLHGGAEAATRPALQKFCEILLDYVSAGHFEIYEQLLNEAEAFGGRSGEGKRWQVELGVESGSSMRCAGRL